MAEGKRFDVFISYRRDGGEILGRLFFEMLKNQYNVFFDHETLSSGRFDTKLLNIIEDCTDVLVLLSYDCLERCKNLDDWFMREISCALKNNKNIILLMTTDFKIPVGAELDALPTEIQLLMKYNAYMVDVAYLDGVVARISHELIAPAKQQTALLAKSNDPKALISQFSAPGFGTLFSQEEKAAILYSAVSALASDYNGEILKSMIERMMQRQTNIRTKYRYETEINVGYDFQLLDIDSDKYNKLTESLSYSKKFFSNAPDKKFWVSFVTNLDELDDSLCDENFFFSENLIIEEQDLKRLSALSNEEKVEFYQSVMRTKINVNGAVLSPTQVLIDEAGIFGQYELKEELLSDSGIFDVKIRFRIPHKKGNTYFFASINDPTYSPFIRFTYPEDDFDVMMIPFLNRSVTAKDTKIFDGVRELSVEREWVIPVSGAVFVITQKF